MSQAEDLLNSLSETTTSYHDTHVVIDSDTYFVIDPITRVIENTAQRKNVLMQFDHNSERFTFEVARYVEGHDMSLCNRVRVHYNNIDGQTGEENADVFDLDDLQVNPDNPETVICSWLISRNSTQLAGSLSFLVQYMCISDEGEEEYEWHSDIYSDIEIKPGRNNAEASVIEYSDILTQWEQRLFGAGDSVMADIKSEGEAQVSAISSEGSKQVAAVKAEGENNLNAIANEGNNQLTAVKDEGEAQLGAITLEGETQVAAVKAEGATQREQLANQISEEIQTYLTENGIQVPSDEHINKLIYDALGVIEDGSY